MSTIAHSPSDDAPLCRAAVRAPAPCSERDAPWVLGATVLGSSMAFIDGTVVNLALAAFQRELDASVAEVQWIVESYALLLAALLLTGGALGDRFGRRRIFIVGVAVFGVASLGCALAPGVWSLVGARALQGLGAALLVPGSLAVLSASFPDERRGRAIGVWAGASAVSAGLGLLLGGLVLDRVGWRWIFAINVPLALATVLITRWRVRESRDPDSAGVDVAGSVLATLSLFAITFGLIEAGGRGLGDPVVLASLAIGALASAGFVIVERRVRHPMVRPAFFANRRFAGANALTLLLYAALAGVLFFVPLDLIQVQGMSAAGAGAGTLPFVLLVAGLSRWAGTLFDRYGFRWPIRIGTTLTGVGMALYAVAGPDTGYLAGFFLPTVLVGAGMGITVTPLTATAMGSLGERHAGVASGVNNAVSRAGALLAVAVLGPVMLAVFRWSLGGRLAAAGFGERARDALLVRSGELAALDVPRELADRADEVHRAVDGAFVDGFRVVTVACGVAAALAGWLGTAWMSATRPVDPGGA